MGTDLRVIRRRLLVAGIILAAGVLMAPAAALAQRQRDVPRPGPLSAGVDLTRMQDRVLHGRPRAAMSAARARAAGHAYRTADGQTVRVEVTPAYTPDAARDKSLVDFLASRLHGAELGALRVYVGTPSEIGRLCGFQDAVACYAADEERMYVPGEASHGIPIEYAMTHEYGHHIASWSDNDPWSALDWGPKRWSSHERVCAHVLDGRLFPGDQGDHYLDDPGEGWADAYAHYHYPQAPWQFNSLLRPDAGAFRAIRRDVRHPWTGPRKRVFRGRLGPGRRARRFRLRLRLDGDITLRLRGPRRADFNLVVRWRHELVARTRRHGSRDAADVGWCRASRTEVATITVVRRRGAGRFRLLTRFAG
ncbi:MAG: hypothetical protein ABR581_02815 [Thermoleophilaceae bacterium]